MSIVLTFDMRGGVFDILLLKSCFFYKRRFSFTDYFKFNYSNKLSQIQLETLDDCLSFYIPHLVTFLTKNFSPRWRACVPNKK